jgi:hypothetical protein
MKTLKHFKIASLLMLVLGVIHLFATPFVFSLFRKNIPQDPTSIYMFVMVGASVIFISWIQYYILTSNNYSIILLRIIESSVLFFLLFGIGAVATMWSNPFAYICLIIAFYEVIQLRYYSIYLNSYFNEHEKD